MKKGFARLLVFALVIGMAATAAAEDLTLATGGTAGTYYPFGGAMAKIWNAKIEGMNVTAQTTGASGENIRLVNKKEAELALVQSDTLDQAWNATEAFKEPLKEMSALAVLYPEIVQVVVATDSPIQSMADLKGKKVGVGAPGSGTEANFRQLLDAYGMTREDVGAQFLSFSESAEAFKDKHIEAFIVTAGIPNAGIMDVATQNTIRILDIPADVAAKMIQKYPFLAPAKIPADTYKGLSTEVSTVAVNAVLIAANDMKPETAYRLTQTLLENKEELAAAHAKGKEVSPAYAVKGVSIPFHPGAVKYYQEKGLMP